MTSQSKPPRALMPDYLRLIALFGIVVVNVSVMAFSQFEGFHAASHMSSLDEITAWLVHGLAYLKTYGLFSFMFGVGLAFQMRAAERRGTAFGPLYRNRMLGLIALGLIHGLLFFSYDILVLYGVVGGILYTMRHWPVARLVRIGAILLGVQILVATLLMNGPDDPELIALERFVMTDGSLGDVIAFRALSFLGTWPFLLVIQGISALGWFALGLAAVRAGLIDQPTHPIWHKARRWCLAPGVALSLLGAGLWQWGNGSVGEILVTASAPIATFGYLGLIAAIARPAGPGLKPWLRAGGSSLTVYLGQSIVLTTLFAPFGLGLWDTVGPATAVVIATLTTLGLIFALTLWHRRFALGPFEWILRRITHFSTPRTSR